MPHLRIILDGDNSWPDLRKVAEDGRLIEYEGDISVAALEGGMVSGKPSVSFRFDLPDGRVLFAQTSMALFLQAAELFRARFQDGSLVWVCDNCKTDYDISRSMCISCGKRNSH